MKTMTKSYFKSEVSRLRNKAKLVSMFSTTSSLPEEELVLELDKISQELKQLNKDYNKKDYSTPSIKRFL